MTIALRPMGPEDVETIEPLERELFPDDPPWTREQFLEELAGVPDTRWYVVAVEEDELTGYAGLRALGMPGEPADIQTIAVAPAHQRRGVGATLMDALITEARARAAGSLLLEVRADNDAALAFYGRYGFERIATRRAYYGGGRDGLVLRMRLPAAP
ncbi:ribosomal protein S18-alanine N-acetyltransferase [Phytoactinopolyspora alkaliphila]|uniref:Ribosomal protein S18-alanine N-acetyltransferase n=1 Tax=Phytoactinopolyspora alkaliphila TaxID=1783498 RepID=A0A6N9YHE7_9ACTN|nr:ribosomal protein S18-alanine N-acetyltransferase [Phytoactinopolyspora alkaliphila]NED94357.1 ribosomal protein S18-alanine N-acetyltransferase [Phytoactinopolyspora alkaliphila]